MVRADGRPKFAATEAIAGLLHSDRARVVAKRQSGKENPEFFWPEAISDLGKLNSLADFGKQIQDSRRRLGAAWTSG